MNDSEIFEMKYPMHYAINKHLFHHKIWTIIKSDSRNYDLRLVPDAPAVEWLLTSQVFIQNAYKCQCLIRYIIHKVSNRTKGYTTIN